jgi:hypothetical protein
MDKIIGWLLFQWADKKRITIAVVAALNLLLEKFGPKLAEAGIPMPGADLIEGASGWIAVMFLAVLSKMSAKKESAPAPAPTPLKP